jgi:hypothetical protein
MLSSLITLAILQIRVYFSQVAEAGGAKKLSMVQIGCSRPKT